MSKNAIRYTLYAVILFGLFWLPAKSGANVAIGADFFLNFQPANPAPNSPVTAKLKSYQFDVNRATIFGRLTEKSWEKARRITKTPDPKIPIFSALLRWRCT